MFRQIEISPLKALAARLEEPPVWNLVATALSSWMTESCTSKTPAAAGPSTIIERGRLLDRAHALFRTMSDQGWQYPLVMRRVTAFGEEDGRQVTNAAAARRFLEEYPARVTAQPASPF